MRTLTKKSFVCFLNVLISQVLARVHLRVFWGNLLLTINKSAGFLEDQKFSGALEAIRSSHDYDAYHAPQSIAWRLHTLVWAATCASKLPGDFVECGVFKGDMSWVVTEMLPFAELGKMFYLYDSFSGFSERYSAPEDFPDVPGFFEHAHRVYSDPSLYSYVVQRFAHLPCVRIVAGVVPDIFATICPESVAFLHLDLNSPMAEAAALEALFDRVVSGGYVVFDDYGWVASRKQKDAIDAFFALRGYMVYEIPTGQGLVIKR